jgi:hypothetical protein
MQVRPRPPCLGCACLWCEMEFWGLHDGINLSSGMVFVFPLVQPVEKSFSLFSFNW